MKERLTAIRASISDVVDGEFGEDEGPYVISPHGVEIRRVLLVGSIVDQVAGNNNYASITLDDGTGSIRAKAWGAEADMLQNVSTNILAMMIGKIREYENEIYIQPEIVKPIDDPNILALHSYERQLAILRLGNKDAATSKKDKGALMAFDKKEESPKQKEKPEVSGLAGQILRYIIEKDNPNGVSIKEIAKHFETKGIDPLQINLELIDLVDNERVIEQEVGVYKPIN